MNNKITDMIVECDSIKLELLDKQKQIHQLKAENTLLTDEKVYFMGELNTTKNQLKEIEASLFEKIRLLQEKCNQEINRIKTESENKINEKTEQTDSLISKMKAEMATIVVDKDKQLESLSNHVKSFTNSQYVTINEIEKLKLVNEKLRADQLVVDKRVEELRLRHQHEMDELKASALVDKQTLSSTYTDSIKKSQEMADAVQIRLNQTMEALSLSKTTISNLKDNNIELEKQLQGKHDDQADIYDKVNELNGENRDLKEKLEKAIQLNTDLSMKERQYETQYKQLQIRYNQILALTKK